MKKRMITDQVIKRFYNYLIEEEKSEATKEKYMRDIYKFVSYCGGKAIGKDDVIAYKQYLLDEEYAVRSVNSMIASLNSLFDYLKWHDMKVKSLRLQQQVFCSEEKELSRVEYERLCRTAESLGHHRISLIIQTICGTGIRVSELQYITVESVMKGEAVVSMKGKTRVIFIVHALKKKLLRYISEQNIKSGSVFVTKNGKPISRTNIWRDMKNLCAEAQVNPIKVFPHNLRHLFARVFYEIENDIVKLADLLGHSSVNTTRIYIISTGIEHRRRMEKMRLVV